MGFVCLVGNSHEMPKIIFSEILKLEAQEGPESLTWIRLIIIHDMLHCAMVAISAIRSDCL